ncbi:MAG: putative sugar nucleotidyl transferase, partial [Rubripirellula sp.]
NGVDYHAMQIICFEDERVEQLRPITQARPAYAITSASFRLLEWLKLVPGSLSGSVRSYLRVIQELDHGIHQLDQIEQLNDDVLLVNARLAPTVGLDIQLQQWIDANPSGVVIDKEDQSILIAHLAQSDLASDDPPTDVDGLLQLAKSLAPTATEESTTSSDWDVFRWPHDVVAHHMKQMADAMNWRLKNLEYTETMDGVFVREGVQIGDYPVVDSSEGPILLEENVQVGPFCYLSGPVYAGAGTRVIEHAALKDGVSLGHTVKIGGEVEASVIEPFTNKQHHGFLGHSYLGSWINLGAGTCNSDLKNTYGKINIQYGQSKVATGMQFLGCFVGDYSKTAINTSIFTGKVIGVCSMMYGFVTSNVPSYVNYARLFGQTSLLPADVMINTQQRMFARRKVEQRECDKQLIRDMYDLSAEERESVDQDIL